MRGQTALEYLITYGWALVAISVIIVLLYYLNVFNPSMWMPVRNEAVGLSVFGVTDFSVNGSGWIVLYIVNNAQASVNLTDIQVQGSSLTSPNPPFPRLLSPGSNLTISGISPIVGNKGDAFYGTAITFNYSIVGGANHTDGGILRGKID